MKLWISTILLGIVLYVLFQFVTFEPCISCNQSIPTMTSVGNDEDDGDDEDNGDDTDSDDDSDDVHR
jgi:hypothetical protein